MKHAKTEYEFIAKTLNDTLKKKYKGRNLGFMTFIFDVGETGHIGFVASSRRIDSMRMIMEWFSHALDELSREDFVEMLEELKKERWDEDAYPADPPPIDPPP